MITVYQIHSISGIPALLAEHDFEDQDDNVNNEALKNQKLLEIVRLPEHINKLDLLCLDSEAQVYICRYMFRAIWVINRFIRAIRVIRDAERGGNHYNNPTDSNPNDPILTLYSRQARAERGEGKTYVKLTALRKELKAPYAPRKYAPPPAGRPGGEDEDQNAKDEYLINRHCHVIPAHFKRLEKEDLFYLLSGDTRDTLKPGVMVTCRVVGHGTGIRKVRCRLENGISGVIDIERDGKYYLNDEKVEESFNLDDRDNSTQTQNDVKYMEKHAPIGATLRVRVLEVQPDRFAVSVAACAHEVNDVGQYWARRLDEHLQQQDLFIHLESIYGRHEDDAAYLEKKRRENNKKRFTSRRIAHPSFKNISGEDAIAKLNAQEYHDGDCIFRPSSRSVNQLSATMKLWHDHYVDVAIKESDKPGGNPLALGNVLTINEEKFEDLDHIIEAYLKPVTSYFVKLKDYRLFRYGTEKELEDMLFAEASKDSKRASYFIGFSSRLRDPQADKGDIMVTGVSFYYLVTKTQVKAKHAAVTARGYRLGNTIYRSVPALIDGFKRAISTRHNKRASAASSKSSRNRHKSSSSSSSRSHSSHGHRQRR